MPRRYALSLPALVVTLLIVTLAAARCGRDKEDNKKDDKKPATTGTGSAGAPADWDGAADWNGSEWEVVEE